MQSNARIPSAQCHEKTYKNIFQIKTDHLCSLILLVLKTLSA